MRIVEFLELDGVSCIGMLCASWFFMRQEHEVRVTADTEAQAQRTPEQLSDAFAKSTLLRQVLKYSRLMSAAEAVKVFF